jgi:hypothetical protein
VKTTAESPIFNVAPKPYKPVGESIGPAVVDTSPTNLSARVEKLERAFAGYDAIRDFSPGDSCFRGIAGSRITTGGQNRG